jgi:hypothetical protein
LVRSVQQFEPPHRDALGVPQLNLMLLGGRASAKSSFINGEEHTHTSTHLHTLSPLTHILISPLSAVLTGLEDGDTLRQRAVVGGADVDVTILSHDRSAAQSAAHANAQLPPTTATLERFHVTPRVALWDSWGWTASAPLDAPTLSAMLDGDLASGWPRSRPVPAALLAQSGAAHALKDRMHGVLLFVPATDVLDADGYLLRAKLVVDVARDKGLQAIVILSMCDKIDAQLAERPAGVYTSEAVQIARSTAASLLQVPLNTVFPCKTYFAEYQRSADIDKLVLTPLKAALDTAGEALRRRYDQQFGAYSSSSGAHVGINVGSSDSTSGGTGIDINGEPLSYVSNRLQPFTQRMTHGWASLFARSSYGPPPTSVSGALRRVTANWTWLFANYMAVILAVWLCFALVHISTQPWLAALVGAVVLLWLILFRALPPQLVVRGWRFGKSQRELLLLLAMIGAFGAVLFGMGVWRPLAFISVAVMPVLKIHSLFYVRVEHILPQDGTVKGV